VSDDVYRSRVSDMIASLASQVSSAQRGESDFDHTAVELSVPG
jgi:hypothetical protein